MKAPAALLALAFLAATTAAAAGKRPQPLLAGLPQSEVRAVTAAGEHRFRVWIAADPDSRARGLMYVREMPADHGMLFLFERAQVASFWMKNTYLPLDLVFIRGDGTVANVARDARPGSLDPITSSAPVIAVLELLAGTAARIGLLPGDRIVFGDAAALEGRVTRQKWYFRSYLTAPAWCWWAADRILSIFFRYLGLHRERSRFDGSAAG